MQHQDSSSSSSIHRSHTPPNQPSHEATQPPLSTPRKPGTPRSTTNVTEHRSIILDQMKDEMVRCDTWDSFNHYLPNVGIGEEHIEAAVGKLEDEGFLGHDSDGTLQFKAFPTNPASIGTPSESTLYEPLVEICKVLRKLKLGDKVASCELVQEPNSYNTAETDGANFKMDAYLRLLDSTMPAACRGLAMVPTADVAVPSEYKIKRGKFVDNRAQLLGTTTFCMNDDPRRMHIYGITIEDSKMNVWYFSRSHSAKSPEFDFTKYPEMYIRVMLSFLFATLEQLGYDPTVKRRLDPANNKLCYVYQVVENPEDRAEKRDRYFKTQGAIFEHRSLCTTGRATRVWEVVEVGSFDDLQPLAGSTMVLKDVWLDNDSKTEGQNLDAIFEQLEKIAAKGDEGIFNGFEEESKEPLRQCLRAKSWGQYFLTKVCDWQGYESKEVSPAAQPDPTLFVSPTSTITPSAHPHSDPTRKTAYQATNPAPVVQNRLPRRYCPKRQYRIIFKEVCEALHDVQQLRDVATALLHSVFALQLMFLARWVHRDISSGNIYAYRESGTDEVRGILADLEYAKPFESEGTSDPKTGTAYFMAVEIQRQKLIYNPAPSRGRPSRRDKNKGGSNLKSSIGVIHNYEHDVESIFWVSLWTLLVRFPPARADGPEQQFQAAVSTIFQDTSLCPPRREDLFTVDNELVLFLNDWLNPDLRPIVNALEALRSALLFGYYEREFNFNNLATYPSLYPYVTDVLEDCLEVALAPRNPMQGRTPGTPFRLAHVMKRKAGVGGGDDDNASSKVGRVEGRTDAASSRRVASDTSGEATDRS